MTELDSNNNKNFIFMHRLKQLRAIMFIYRYKDYLSAARYHPSTENSILILN